MTRHDGIGQDPDHRLKIVSWSWRVVEVGRYDNSWVYGRRFNDVVVVGESFQKRDADKERSTLGNSDIRKSRK